MRPVELYAAGGTIAGPEMIPAADAAVAAVLAPGVSSVAGKRIAVERPSRRHVPAQGHSHLKGCRP